MIEISPPDNATEPPRCWDKKFSKPDYGPESFYLKRKREDIRVSVFFPSLI
jgi:hypothetical protein